MLKMAILLPILQEFCEDQICIKYLESCLACNKHSINVNNYYDYYFPNSI